MTGEGPSRPSGGGDTHWQGSSGGLNLPRMSNRLPVGPGSRGGTYHQDPAGYFRRYRREHPEYRRREVERKSRARQEIADEIPMPLLSDALRSILREEVAKSSMRQVAHEMLVDHSWISRSLAGKRVTMSGAVMDAMVEHYGLDRVVSEMRLLRAEARRARAAAQTRA